MIKSNGGRPTKYNAKLADDICTRLIRGESLISICRDEDMPDETQVYRWLTEKPEFRQKYSTARELQTERFVEETISIADELPVHEVPDVDGGTSMRIDAAGISRNKLRVDTRKWWASKLLPRKYGDKIAQEISGPDGGAVDLNTQLHVHFVKAKDGRLAESEDEE